MELYNAGTAINTLFIDHLICISGGCMTKSSFNKNYLNSSYPNNFIKNILMYKPIFNKKGYRKTEDGFEQVFKSDTYTIYYKVNRKGLYFKDQKNHILLKLKDIDE